jgi:hypothetical protein
LNAEYFPDAPGQVLNPSLPFQTQHLPSLGLQSARIPDHPSSFAKHLINISIAALNAAKQLSRADTHSMALVITVT